jgi:hypothetical protein
MEDGRLARPAGRGRPASITSADSRRADEGIRRYVFVTSAAVLRSTPSFPFPRQTYKKVP